LPPTAAIGKITIAAAIRLPDDESPLTRGGFYVNVYCNLEKEFYNKRKMREKGARA
jgi:hypothetical protein